MVARLEEHVNQLDEQDARLNAALRARRKELRLSQQDLAELAGVSVRFIHDLENGKSTVQLDRVLTVAGALGLELAWHVRRPGQGPKPI